MQERNGRLYRPEHPKAGDCCDAYTIYQIRDTLAVPYSFMPYEAAAKKLHPSHYCKAYQGMLAPGVTLESLYRKHNMDGKSSTVTRYGCWRALPPAPSTR